MSMPDPSLWREMLQYLRRHHPQMCRGWFESELEPLRLEGGVFEVRARNAIQRNYLARQCAEPFNEAAQTVSGALLVVRFVEAGAEDDPAKPDPRSAGPAATSDPRLRRTTGGAITPRDSTASRSHPNPLADPYAEDDDDQIVLSPDYRFENFVTGPGNNLAHAASLGVADKPGESINPLFIHGGVGLGKTHLLQAICQQLLDGRPDARICYLSCDSFMTRFLDAIQSGHMNEFRHRYRHVDLLLVDDIHLLTNRERTQEEFFHTFNTLYQFKKQIVLSSDSPPGEIPQLEERLVSRFNWGLVARIDRPCYETRVAILRKKAAQRGVEVPGDAVCHIAARLESNIRELEGAITKVQSLAMLRGVPIDLSLTRQALGEDEPVPTGPQLSIQNVIDAVTRYYGVKLSDLQSKRRHRSITMPRQVCMYLARKRTRYSLEEIGGYFGGRDHTTVMHAIKTTDQRAASEPTFAGQIEQIDRELTAGGP